MLINPTTGAPWLPTPQECASVNSQLRVVGYSHVKAADTPARSYSMAGRLIVTKDNWGLIEVPNALARGIFDALHEPGLELPTYEGKFRAHISVLRPEEVERIGGADRVSERGHTFHYSLGRIVSFDPSGWRDVSKCWAVEVQSPELERMRMAYGLTRYPKHAFHITVAVRRVNVIRDRTDAVKRSAADIPGLQELVDSWKPLGPDYGWVWANAGLKKIHFVSSDSDEEEDVQSRLSELRKKYPGYEVTADAETPPRGVRNDEAGWTMYKRGGGVEKGGSAMTACDPKLPYRQRAEVYAVKDGKVLSGILPDGNLLLFGGGVDPGEEPGDAAAREITEETGWKVKNLTKVNVPPLTSDWPEADESKLTPKQVARRKQFRGDVTHYFTADIDGERTKAEDPTNAKKLAFRHPHEIHKILTARGDKLNDYEKRHLDHLGVYADPSSMEESRLTVYPCPECGGDAHNGDAESGVRFRGGGKCSECGHRFSLAGLRLQPKQKEGPLLQTNASRFADHLSSGYHDARFKARSAEVKVAEEAEEAGQDQATHWRPPAAADELVSSVAPGSKREHARYRMPTEGKRLQRRLWYQRTEYQKMPSFSQRILHASKRLDKESAAERVAGMADILSDSIPPKIELPPIEKAAGLRTTMLTLLSCKQRLNEVKNA